MFKLKWHNHLRLNKINTERLIHLAHLMMTFCVCVKRVTICNFLCPFSSCDSASVIQNIGGFGAKNYFTNHRTDNTIHGFRDSVPVLKIHSCYYDTQKFEQLSIPIDSRRELYVDVNKPLQNSFQTLQTVYTYSNCILNQLLHCWQMI